MTFEELLQQPVFLQIWSDFLSPSHTVRLFLLLNAGQQKVSSRHLLEVLGGQLQQMFDKWGIPWITERAEREKLRAVKGGARKFGYNFLLTGLVAYLKGDQHIKTDMIVSDRTDTGNFDLDIDDKIQAAGDETCRRDFTWACLDLNKAICDNYDTDRPRNLIWSTDTFFVPLMAAIGKARQRDYPVEIARPSCSISSRSPERTIHWCSDALFPTMKATASPIRAPCSRSSIASTATLESTRNII